MANFEASKTIALFSHVGTGKTSLSDAIAFNEKLNSRLGKVDNGTSFFDCEPEEIKRKSSISASIASFKHSGVSINFIDTPGGANFIAETLNIMQIADDATIVIDSIDGIKPYTAKMIKKIENLNIPITIFINKLDRDNSNYKNVLSNINSYFSSKPVLLQIPIGEKEHFKGIIDLLKFKAYIYKNDESGIFEETSIPEELMAEATSKRDEAIEAIVESDDAVLIKYLEGEILSNDEIILALQKGISNRQIIPILMGSALKNQGANLFMDFIASYMPCLPERYAEVINVKDEKIELKPNDLTAFVFKTISDPYAGQLSIIKILSGEITSDSNIYNANRGIKERIGQLFQLSGKIQNPINNAKAGDIIAIAKLKDTHTGDTFSEEFNPVLIKPIELPHPVISFAIQPKTKGDEEKIQAGLKRLTEEDSTLQIFRDTQTKELILSGMGQVHLDISIEKLKRKFGVEVVLETPKIPYKETLTQSIKVQGKYKKQSGGKGQYGDCWIEINPLARGQGFQFVDKIVGGAIPRQYIPAIESGIKEAMNEGIIANHPVVDVQIVLYDGSYHPVDSSEMAFKVAGSMAFKKGALLAKPVLLEPIMHVEITAPEQNIGDIMGDLNSRRGRMLGVDADNSTQTVKANIPMAEMLKYAPDLNSMTSGAGIFTMEFSHYEEVPAHISQKIISSIQVA